MDLKDSFNNITNSNININLPHPQNPKQLSHSGGIKEIVGRVDELKEIEQDLSNTDALLLINGIGGIGKSTIAGYYLHSKKDKYDYFGFFEGIDGFESELIKLFDITDLENGFDIVLQKLRLLDGKKLIVIDNIKDLQNNKSKIERILGLSASGYKIILTSRVAISLDGLKDFNLDRLSENDSIELFKKYCSSLSDENIVTITEAFDGHPLFIELVAKAISSGIDKDEIISKINSQELSKIEYIDDEGEILNFEKNLEVLFELQKNELKENYLKILQKLSLLPAIEIKKELLKDIFSEDNQILAKLNFLVKIGWLIKIDNSFKMHQIVKEFFLAKNTPPENMILDLVDFYNEKFLKNSTNALVTSHIIYFLDLFISLEDLILKFNIKNKNVSEYFNNLGNLFANLNEYEKAETLYNFALEILLKLRDGENDVELGIIYQNLATVSTLQGKFSNTISLLKESINILEKFIDENKSLVLVAYNNLAEAYRFQKEYKKAEKIHIKVLKERKKIFGNLHIDIAISYNNLALLYSEQGKYKKSEKFFKKSIFINEKLYDGMSPYLATNYNNLAKLYLENNKIKKAREYMIKGIKIMHYIYPNGHPNLYDMLKDLTYIEFFINEFD